MRLNYFVVGELFSASSKSSLASFTSSFPSSIFHEFFTKFGYFRFTVFSPDFDRGYEAEKLIEFFLALFVPSYTAGKVEHRGETALTPEHFTKFVLSVDRSLGCVSATKWLLYCFSSLLFLFFLCSLPLPAFVAGFADDDVEANDCSSLVLAAGDVAVDPPTERLYTYARSTSERRNDERTFTFARGQRVREKEKEVVHLLTRSLVALQSSERASSTFALSSLVPPFVLLTRSFAFDKEEKENAGG